MEYTAHEQTPSRPNHDLAVPTQESSSGRDLKGDAHYSSRRTGHLDVSIKPDVNMHSSRSDGEGRLFHPNVKWLVLSMMIAACVVSIGVSFALALNAQVARIKG
jgi:hypothetical protein